MNEKTLGAVLLRMVGLAGTALFLCWAAGQPGGTPVSAIVLRVLAGASAALALTLLVAAVVYPHPIGRFIVKHKLPIADVLFIQGLVGLIVAASRTGNPTLMMTGSAFFVLAALARCWLWLRPLLITWLISPHVMLARTTFVLTLLAFVMSVEGIELVGGPAFYAALAAILLGLAMVFTPANSVPQRQDREKTRRQEDLTALSA